MRSPPLPALPLCSLVSVRLIRLSAGEGIDLFTLAFFGVFAGVFGNAILKSIRKKREFRDCRRMLAKLKRASAGRGGQAGAALKRWGRCRLAV